MDKTGIQAQLTIIKQAIAKIECQLNKEQCPECQSSNYYVTGYQYSSCYQCKDCGHTWGCE